MTGIIGKKIGMTQLFDEDGNVVAVTVIEAGPCPVTLVRTVESDGYEAVQLAFEDCRDKHLTKAELGHLTKAGVKHGKRHLAEIRGAGDLKVGDMVTVEAFEDGQQVSVVGVSKGKGFQGTVKRHNFARVPRPTVRITSANRVRSAPARILAASSRACACRAIWGASVSRNSASRSCVAIRRTTSC